MRKFRIEAVIELELPDDCSILPAPDRQVIKLGTKYIWPSMNYLETENYSTKEMRFKELDEETLDQIYAGLAFEKIQIREIENTNKTEDKDNTNK